jgi:hypothetical protein
MNLSTGMFRKLEDLAEAQEKAEIGKDTLSGF